MRRSGGYGVDERGAAGGLPTLAGEGDWGGGGARDLAGSAAAVARAAQCGAAV